MKALQSIGAQSLALSKGVRGVFRTGEDASAAEILLRGAALPITVWAFLYASLEWLA